jgi:hypothetical protein
MTEDAKKPTSEPSPEAEKKPEPAKKMPKEINGPKGPEPTRYGDWERNGIASDF